MINQFKSKLKSIYSGERWYYMAVFSVVTLVIFNQMLIQYTLSQQWFDAKTISLASKQSMLSYEVVDLSTSTTYHEIEGKPKLWELTDNWNQVHLALQQGSKELGVDKLDSKKVNAMFAQINPHQKMIFEYATGMDVSFDREQLVRSASIYGKVMDDIVLMCEEYSQIKLILIIAMEIVLAVITLLVLLLEFKYIFRPAFKRIKNQQQQILEENHSLLETQELLNAIQDSTSIFNIVVDQNFDIINYNQGALKYFAIDESGTQRKTLFDYLPIHVHTGFEDYINTVFDGQNAIFDEYCFVNELETQWFGVEFHPMIHHLGKIDGVVLSFKDITEQKKFHIELEQQNDKLRQIAFVQAHELRGPITSMISLIDLMEVEEQQYDSSGSVVKRYAPHFKQLSEKVDGIIKHIVFQSEEEIAPNS